MELHFKEFMLLELFDSSVEIDWGTGASAAKGTAKWQGFFFVPVKGMNLDGAQALRQKQLAMAGASRYAAPPGHIKYVVNIMTYYAKPEQLQQHGYDVTRLNTQGLLIADVSFQRFKDATPMQKAYATYERPEAGERQPNDKLVFGTVLKACQDVMQKGANITGIRFVSHQDNNEESASKRLSTYKMLAKVIAPKYGFEQIQSSREADILLVKKDLFYPVAKIAPPTQPGQPQPPAAIPVARQW